MRFLPVIVSALSLLATAVHAHEFWIEPKAYGVEPGGTIAADFVVGQQFKGRRLRYFANDSARMELQGPPGTDWKPPRTGDAPAFRATAGDDGLMILVHETAGDTLRYKTDELFPAFVKHKDMRGVMERHLARDLPLSGFIETYSRHVKALVAVGDGAGSDHLFGMKTELVALANPYTDDLGDGLPVQLYWQGAPLAGAQVELFERAPDGTVADLFFRTDAQGIARLPVRPGHTYLADAVRMVELPGKDVATDAMWHSYWAALTFAVPE